MRQTVIKHLFIRVVDHHYYKDHSKACQVNTCFQIFINANPPSPGVGVGCSPRKCLGKACRGHLEGPAPCPGASMHRALPHTALPAYRQRAARDGTGFIPIVHLGTQSHGLVRQPGRDREAGDSPQNARSTIPCWELPHLTSPPTTPDLSQDWGPLPSQGHRPQPGPEAQ